MEALYEKRLKKKQLQKEQEDNKLEVDPVDALPVKTLDGQLLYRTGFLLFSSYSLSDANCCLWVYIVFQVVSMGVPLVTVWYSYKDLKAI